MNYVHHNDHVKSALTCGFNSYAVTQCVNMQVSGHIWESDKSVMHSPTFGTDFETVMGQGHFDLRAVHRRAGVIYRAEDSMALRGS